MKISSAFMSIFVTLFFQQAHAAQFSMPELKDSKQIMVVSEKKGVQAELSIYEKDQEDWVKVRSFPAVIGQAGFAAKGEKLEGDQKTPTGIYNFTTAWSYHSKTETEMPIRQVTEVDKFIDDVNSKEYNTWVTGPTKAKSFEKLRRKDALYEYGLVIDYNMNPIIKEKGSAIFLHVWRTPVSGTAGCVALAKESVIEILKWLSPDKNPKIILNL